MRNVDIRTRGINHVALVCKDMTRTVDFYTNVLGMPLVKTVELPENSGQHFFFECGGGSTIAFFNFPDAPDPVVGISQAEGLPDRPSLLTSVGSMNHLAFLVEPDEIEGFRQRLIDLGLDVTDVWNHDESEWGLARSKDDPGVFVRSVYFRDPDGILLEFAAWTRALTPADVRHEPWTAASA